jgi:acetyltransferase-like isoleucine patch superfamily enzyme
MSVVKKLFSWIVRTRWLHNSNVEIAPSAIFKGFPRIEVDNGKLIIKENAVINSWQRGYHINMFAKTRLFVEGKDAVLSIGKNTRIHASCIHATDVIQIGDNCLIAANCQIFDSSGHDTDIDPSQRIHSKGFSKKIVIEDNVWIGTGVIVLPGVTIGEGSVIAAGSVVAKDIPRRVLAAGAPAKAVRPLRISTN